jgi:hypothetical protein
MVLITIPYAVVAISIANRIFSSGTVLHANHVQWSKNKQKKSKVFSITYSLHKNFVAN